MLSQFTFVWTVGFPSAHTRRLMFYGRCSQYYCRALCCSFLSHCWKATENSNLNSIQAVPHFSDNLSYLPFNAALFYWLTWIIILRIFCSFIMCFPFILLSHSIWVLKLLKENLYFCALFSISLFLFRNLFS